MCTSMMCILQDPQRRHNLRARPSCDAARRHPLMEEAFFAVVRNGDFSPGWALQVQ